jgi:hypothetical protein
MSYVVNQVDGLDSAGEPAKEDIVAYVRLAEGGSVKLYSGDTVPPEADLNHVAKLVQMGVLSATEDEPDGIKPNSIEAILAAVGGVPETAQRYLDEERAAQRPRKTLIEALEAVIADES